MSVPDVLQQVARLAVEGTAQGIECGKADGLRFLVLQDGKDVFALGEVGDEGVPIPTGLPMLVLWDGKHADVVSGEESLAFLSQLDMP